MTRDIDGGHEAVSPAFAILRDIARGGIAGVITGILAAGIGGRVAMRLAALIVPDSMGRLTENGNRIGEITAGGTFGLIAFGMVVGLGIGGVWVAVAPFIPGRGGSRALWAMPIAVAVGGFGFVDGANRDFDILGHNPLVVVVLLITVAAIGLVVVILDTVLERRMPRSGGRAAVLYAIMAALGGVIIVPVLFFGFFSADNPRIALGVALDGLLIATIAWWVLRLRGATSPPRPVLMAGRVCLLAVVLLGMTELIPEVRGALGIA